MAELEIKPSHFGLRGFIPNYDATQLLKQLILSGNIDFVPAGSFPTPCGGREWGLSLAGLKVWPPENCSPQKSLGLGHAVGRGIGPHV